MKISIITICYNAKTTIAETLESVLSQTCTDLEYIIVDGCSTDGTVDIVKQYSNRISKFISEPDLGLYDALNKGIKLATGDVVGIMHANDYYANSNVLTNIQNMFALNNIECCCGNVVFVKPDDPNHIIRTWHSCDFKPGLFAKSWSPAHPTFFCKRELFEKYGYYRLDLPIAADVELMYRFLEKHRLKSKFINKNLVVMRTGGASTSGLKSTIAITKEVRRGILDNGGGFNIIKYLFFKALKIREYIVKNNSASITE